MTTRWCFGPVLAIALGVVVTGCTGEPDPLADTTVATPDSPEATVPSTLAATVTDATDMDAPSTLGDRATTSTGAPVTVSSEPVACGEMTVGPNEFVLTAGGADHPVRVFVPSRFDGGRLPTVLNWHGLGGNGSDHAAVTRYEAMAETEVFIVVHPTGVPDVGDTRNSWQLAAARDGESGGDERNDLAFADALIDHMIDEWCTDPNRVYSTGMSNGGFFTARLVCELADRLAAASSVGGLYHPDGCAPARPVPYIAYHGTDDLIVPFDGNGESVLLAAGPDPAMQVFAEQVIPEEFAEFAADASCDLSPGTSMIGDVTRYDYADCESGTPMSFFEVAGGGHTWPNWPIADAVGPTFGYTTTAVDATVDSWQFFERHSLTG